MKFLYLLRHAKSSWDQPGITDRDRILSQRGIRACALLAGHFSAHRVVPDFIWCSTARRTRETLDHISTRAGWKAPQVAVTYADDLYLASADEIAAHLRLTGNAVQTVMVIGHNPGLEDLARSLIREDPGGHRDALERKYPTGGVAVFGYPAAQWSSLAARSCTLCDFVTPRQLEGIA